MVLHCPPGAIHLVLAVLHDRSSYRASLSSRPWAGLRVASWYSSSMASIIVLTSYVWSQRSLRNINDWPWSWCKRTFIRNSIKVMKGVGATYMGGFKMNLLRALSKCSAMVFPIIEYCYRQMLVWSSSFVLIVWSISGLHRNNKASRSGSHCGAL